MLDGGRSWRRRGSYELHVRAIGKFILNYRGERHLIARQFLFDCSRLISPCVAVDADGIRYYVSTSDKGVGRRTFVCGNFDQEKLALAVRLAEVTTHRRLKGMELLDIGANIGTTAIPAIKHFGATHVWAFEPAPDNLRMLQCNIAANDIGESISVVPLALSDRTGVVAFELSPDNSGDHRVAVSNQNGCFREGERVRVNVQVARFDDVAIERGIDVEDLGLVWIDTQGHEGAVLAGADLILKSSVAVLVEYWPYGLRRSAGLKMFHDIVASNYSTVIDIGGTEPIEYRARDVAALEAKYTGVTFTDLLLA